VKNLFLVIFLFFTSSALYAETDSSISATTLQKVIYLNFENIPKRIVKGEIFSVTIKALSTVPRKYPAIEPNIRPIIEAKKALPTPISKETLPPSITLAKISRPKRSVPNK
jgi:hypothetical protein